MVEDVETFSYLGRTLYQIDDDWPSVRRNIMCARLVWGVLGTLIWMEGEYPRVAAMFYRSVVQGILLYGLDMWVLSSAMQKKVEGSHTSFLRHITGKRAWRIVDEMWETHWAELVQELAGTQSEMTYIGRRQETVSQWVVSRPIFEVCEG